MNTSAASNSTEQLKAGHAPATIVGGRRKSQASYIPTLSKEAEAESKSMDARGSDGEEEDGHELIRQAEMDKEFLHEQVQKRQQHEIRNQTRHTNAELNRAPNPVLSNQIRQPSRFPAGLPKETKMAMKSMQ
ncbi:hypothetical protein GGI04_001336 [Coemansia thaxteri]|uniref:Uncharacterized protein n=1 Tax=Coemansia thaxteri TaxID=2663907 RepID=A0A9W8BG27_9FUNG|nr:hypothetical protein H4R26_002674 [Coemansia thaxteri]KAJ2007898.1 hypothetical protein GGI04_001336 [Coemansia thaxteri]KAJ2467331.1 hypothetical protein GGI02_004070 [Coemansia sp. RSA 2322]KAJ2484451.1 hypothetical protein EV174_002427 [Coemansia sp. RSA 2320]